MRAGSSCSSASTAAPAPAGKVEGLAEYVLEIVLTCDLTGDVANGAPQKDSVDAKRIVGTIGLYCMCIALVPKPR